MANLRIGIFGARRGVDIIHDLLRLNCDVVAICDRREEVLQNAAKELGGDVALYTDFDDFIEHDMDAVVLANFFNEHAPYAIKCFERGLHVYSECISNGTMAEGVELVRAFEKSNCVYMLAENYPQSIFCREIKRISAGGTLGKIVYAEGEYNHPVDPRDIEFKRMHVYTEKHWRNFLPTTYYITHSLGPIMWATGATPQRVTAFESFVPVEGDVPSAKFSGDSTAIITTQNDDGSVFRVTGCAHFGGRHNSYRVCGTEGQIENLRGMGNQIMLRYNPWSKPEGAEEINLYTPEWNDREDPSKFKDSGHGGGDYLTTRMFIDCVKAGRQPEMPFDLYSATVMSSVAILGNRSMTEGGKPYDIPDFRKESDRKLYENDRVSPFYGPDGKAPDIGCSTHPDYRPTEEQLREYRQCLNIR